MVTGPLPEGVNPSLGQKVVASLISGSIAITVANPTDLVKVKMQGQGVAMMKGEPKLYNGSMHCYKVLLAEGGLSNLWTGWGPNVFRNSIINAAELASYDQLKQIAMGRGMKDAIPCHVACAAGAGFIATIIGSPLDVVKTRVMNAPAGMYSNPVDCVVKTAKNEGFMAFYKGFPLTVTRISGWNVVMFLTLEQIKKVW